MQNRYKPVGWRRESYRHSLAARGYHSKKHPKRYFGVFVYRKSLGGKHRGDETDNERRAMYGMGSLQGDQRMSEVEQKKYADAMLRKDEKGDIEEIRFTEDASDMMISQWKDGRWRSGPEEDDEDEGNL